MSIFSSDAWVFEKHELEKEILKLENEVSFYKQKLDKAEKSNEPITKKFLESLGFYETGNNVYTHQDYFFYITPSGFHIRPKKEFDYQVWHIYADVYNVGDCQTQKQLTDLMKALDNLDQ